MPDNDIVQQLLNEAVNNNNSTANGATAGYMQGARDTLNQNQNSSEYTYTPTSLYTPGDWQQGAAYISGANQYQQDLNAPQNADTSIGDYAQQAGSSLLQAIGNLGQTGAAIAGLVPDAINAGLNLARDVATSGTYNGPRYDTNHSGRWAAAWEREVEDADQTLSPDAFLREERALQAQAAIQAEQRRQRYEEDKTKYGEVQATLKDFGREAVDASRQVFSSPSSALRLGANAASDIALQWGTAGAVTRGAKGLANLATRGLSTNPAMREPIVALEQKGVDALANKVRAKKSVEDYKAFTNTPAIRRQNFPNQVRARANELARRETLVNQYDNLIKADDEIKRQAERLYLAATEAGGNVGQLTNEIQNTPHDILMTNSPVYAQRFRELINTGISPTDASAQAKEDVATLAEHIAFGPNALSALSASSLAQRAMRARPGVGGAFASIGQEALEEGLTGAGQQLGTNLARSVSSNQNQRLAEGVGSAMAESALAAALGTSALRSPQIAVGTARNITQPIANSFREAQQAKQQKNKQEGNAILQSFGTNTQTSQNLPQGTTSATQTSTPTGSQNMAQGASNLNQNIGTTPTSEPVTEEQARANAAKQRTPEEINQSSGPDVSVEDSSFLDNEVKDANGLTEAMRYAQKQKDYIWGDGTQERDRIITEFSNFYNTSPQGVQDIKNAVKNPNDPQNRQFLENISQSAVHLIKGLDRAESRFKNITDINREDYQQYKALRNLKDFSSTLRLVQSIYDAIKLDDVSLAQKAEARTKFIRELIKGNVEEKRADEVIKQAQSLGFNQQEINFLKDYKQLTQTLQNIAEQGTKDGVKEVLRNIYTTSNNYHSANNLSLKDITDRAINAYAEGNINDLSSALIRLANLKNSVMNRAEALNYGVRNKTNANIEYHTAGPINGEQLLYTVHMGSVNAYKATVQSANDLNLLSNKLIDFFLQRNPELGNLTDTFGNSLADKRANIQVASQSELQPFFNKDPNSSTNNQQNRTITLAERFKPNNTQNQQQPVKSKQPSKPIQQVQQGVNQNGRVPSSGSVEPSNASNVSSHLAQKSKAIRDTVARLTHPTKYAINTTKSQLGWDNFTGGIIYSYIVKFPKSLGLPNYQVKTTRAAYLLAQSVVAQNPNNAQEIKSIRNSLVQTVTKSTLNKLAERLKKQLTPEAKEKWNQIKDDVMLNALISKFNTDTAARDLLVSTDDRKLVTGFTDSKGNFISTANTLTTPNATINDLYVILRELYKQNNKQNLEPMTLDEALAKLGNNVVSEPVREEPVQTQQEDAQQILTEVQAEPSVADVDLSYDSSNIHKTSENRAVANTSVISTENEAIKTINQPEGVINLKPIKFKGLAKEVTLSDGTKIYTDVLSDLSVREQSLINQLKSNKKEPISKKETADIGNTLLQGIRNAVFTIRPELKDIQGLNHVQIIDKLKKNIKDSRNAENLINIVRDTYRYMNQCLADSKYLAEINNDFFNNPKYREQSFISKFKGAANQDSARAALFANFSIKDNQITAQYDPRMAVVGGLSLVQTLNDMFNRQKPIEPDDIDESLKRLGIPTEIYDAQSPEFKQAFATGTSGEAFSENFMRYFYAMTGWRNNNTVSKTHDGDAMVKAYAAQLFKYAQKQGWVDFKVWDIKVPQEDGTKETVRVPIININQTFKEATYERIRNQDKSIRSNSFFLPAEYSSVITDLIPSNEDVKGEYYLDQEAPPLSEATKLRTSTPYTEEELQALGNLRKIKNYLNKPFYRLTKLIGLEGFLDFNGVNIDLTNEGVINSYNKRHFDSVKGTYNTLANSYAVNMNRALRLEEEGLKQSVQNPYVRFNFKQTTAGRWQEDAPVGPQGDKFARQLLAHIRQEIDKSNEKDMYPFRLAVLQAFGKKLEELTPSLVQEQFNTLVDIAKQHQGWSKINDRTRVMNELHTMFNQIQKAGFDGFSILGLNTLLNLEDYIDNNPKFIATVYLELDGSANGFVNSTFKLSAGPEFTKEEVLSLNRGAIFLGVDMNKHTYKKKGDLDNYSAAGKNAPTMLNEFWKRLPDDDSPDGAILQSFALALYRVLNIVAGKDFEFSTVKDPKTGQVNDIVANISRGIIKYKVVGANYGQQVNSLTAATFLELIEQPIYQHMSDALQNADWRQIHSPGEAYFFREIKDGLMTPTQANTEFGNIMNVLDVLYTHKIVTDADGNIKFIVPRMTSKKNIAQSEINLSNGPFLNFWKYNRDIRKAFREFNFDIMKTDKFTRTPRGNSLKNFRTLFGQTVFDAVQSARSPGMMETIRAINRVSNVMAITAQVIENNFINEVQEKLHRAPSNHDLASFRRKNAWSYNFYRGKTILDLGVTQRIRIENSPASTALSVVPGSDVYQSSNNERLQSFSVRPTINISAPPGVRGIAITNIALGDGVMQTWLFAHIDELYEEYKDRGLTKEHLLQMANLFDGVECPPTLNPIFSEIINRAAYEVIRENPLESFNNSWNTYMANLRELKKKNPDVYKQIVEAVDTMQFNDTYYAPIDEEVDNQRSGVNTVFLSEELPTLTQEIADKHQLIEEIGSVISHMSVNENAYIRHPDKFFADINPNELAPEELAEAMVTRLNNELDKIKKRKTTATEPDERQITEELPKSEKKSIAQQSLARQLVNGTNITDRTRSPNKRKRSIRWDVYFKKKINEVLKSEKEKNFFNKIIENNLPDNVQIKVMTRDEILKEVPENSFGSRTKGLFVPETNTIYLVKGLHSSEVKAHEIVHAVLNTKLYRAAKLAEAKHLTSKDRAAAEAYRELRDITDEIIEMNIDDLSSEEKVVLRRLQNILSNIPVESVRVDELIAYSLTNSTLKNILLNKKRKTSSPWFKRISTAVLRAINKIFGIDTEQDLNYLSSYYGNITASTAVITGLDTVTEPDSGSVKQFVSLSESEDPRLTKIISRYDKMLEREGFFKFNSGRNYSRAADLDSKTIALNQALAIAQSNGLLTTPQELEAAKYIALPFIHGFNPKNKTEVFMAAENLRTIVRKTLTPKDFLGIANNNPDSARAIYSILTNAYDLKFQGQSLTLPLFMALASASKKVRDVLGSKEYNIGDLHISGWSDKTPGLTKFDDMVANAAQQAVNKISEVFANSELKKMHSALDAVDSLVDALADQKKEVSLLRGVNDLATRADDYASGLLHKLGTKGLNNQTLSEMTFSDNIFKAGFANTIQRISQGLTKDGAEDLSEFIHKQASEYANAHDNNSSHSTKLFRDLFLTISNEIFSADSYSNLVQKYEKQMKSVVQQARSDYREQVPAEISKMFSKEGIDLTKESKTKLNNALLKTDIGALTDADLDAVLSGDGNNLEARKRHYEAEIRRVITNPRVMSTVIKKSNELADFMVNRKIAPSLLRNSASILKWVRIDPNPDLNKSLNIYISFLALQKLDSDSLNEARRAYQIAPKAMKYVINQQRQLAQQEWNRAEASRTGIYNLNKGYYPRTAKSGSSLIAVERADIRKFESMGYTLLHAVQTVPNMYYMVNNINPTAMFTQGAIQTVLHSAGGSDSYTGFTKEPVIRRYKATRTSTMMSKTTSNEGFIPVFNSYGRVVAYDCVADTELANNIYQYESDFTKNLGNWMGRQFEEDTAASWNTLFIEKLGEAWKDAKRTTYTEGFVDVFKIKDPVIQDALKNLSKGAREAISNAFGEDGFMVRRDMVEDVIGHRRASVVDAWTGNSRWSPETLDKITSLAGSILGKKAMNKLLVGERVLQAASSYARDRIVIASGLVSLANLKGNALFLITSGVPLTSIISDSLHMVKETEMYNRGRKRIIQLQMKRNAIDGERKPGYEIQLAMVDNEINAIKASWQRMDIWPVLEAGEYNTVADVGSADDDILLSTGKTAEYIEKVADATPDILKQAARYLFITKDTPIYRGLEKVNRYGDFISKAVLYKYLTQRRGKTNEEALDEVRYAFVNYDMLAGRSREYLESIGLLWFYNYKLRAVRIACSMIKNNPFKSFWFGSGLLPSALSDGTPLTDNIVGSFLQDKLPYSFGPITSAERIIVSPADNLWGTMF